MYKLSPIHQERLAGSILQSHLDYWSIDSYPLFAEPDQNLRPSESLPVLKLSVALRKLMRRAISYSLYLVYE